MKAAITGAAGRIGRKLRAALAGRFETLRVCDRLPFESVGPGEEPHVFDLADSAALDAALGGVDAVIHMAGRANGATLEEVLEPNIVNTWRLYEAARRAGVRRVVFGGSNHAVGFYARGERIDETAPLRPDGAYGVSKAFGELVASLYYDKHAIRSLCVRIGNAADAPEHERSLAMWISGRDLAQLCLIGIEHPDVTCDVVYGVSDNPASFYDNSLAYALGYRPQDSAETFREQAMAGEAALTHAPASLIFQGGGFCAQGYVEPPRPPRPKGPVR